MEITVTGGVLSQKEIDAYITRLANIAKKNENYVDISKMISKRFEDLMTNEKEKLENFNVMAENLLSQKDGLQVKLYAKYDELSDLRNCEVYLDRLCGEGSLPTLWNGPTTINTKTSDFILFDFKNMSKYQISTC